VIVREARPEEYKRVGDLTVDAYRALTVDHLWGGYDTDILDVAGRAEHADILVAVDEATDEILGAVTFVSEPGPWLEWTEPGEVQFRLLAVDRGAQGRGIGELLARACIERAGGRPICIHTTEWMPAARRLYERLGFVRRPDRDVPYEEWHEETIDDLPEVWRGQPFMAYLYE
jgi:ribosomal protein S18 acetylase RimI-like enzyme